MEILLVRVAKSLILPPGGPLVLLLLALLLWRWRRPARILLATGIVTLYLAAIPATTGWLAGGLEPPAGTAWPAENAAIVVLSGGRYADAPEYGGEDRAGVVELRRLLHARHVHRATGLPVLVSGGKPLGEDAAGARLMERTLERVLDTPVRWTEPESRNTWENAVFSAHRLEAAGLERVVLVTHAAHMRRAAACFRAQGLAVHPAPTGYHTADAGDRGLLAWVPDAGNLLATRDLLHEYLGLAWYRVRYSLDTGPSRQS